MSEAIDQKSEVPEINGEQAAELAAIHALAADQVIPGAPVPEPEPEQEPLAVQISGMLTMLVAMSAPIFPSLKAIYTEEAIEKVGIALEPVCNKHGWLQDGIGGKYGEEMMALVIVGPLAYATYAGISNDIASRKPQKEIKPLAGPENMVSAAVERPSGESNPGAVTIGAVIPNG